jgi:hypothetical protein
MSTAKRILTDIRIDKISAVDIPCQQLASARLMKRDNSREPNMNLAELESELNSLISKIDDALDLDKRKQKFTLTHDDGHDDGDYGDASDNDENEGDKETIDEVSNPGKVRKASINEFVRANDEDSRPGSLSSSTHGQGRHKFEAMADKIANEEGIPKSEATRQARLRFPDDYAAYVKHTNIGKAADDLIAAEIRKGFTPRMAAQRVANAHGFPAFDNSAISKSDIAAADLDDVADAIFEGDGSLSRTESLRKVRLQNPGLYKRMQRA